MQEEFIYPQTQVKTVKENIHGYVNVDHFRWLEGDEQGKMTREVANWTDAQNACTREVMDNLPGRGELQQRIKPLLAVGAISIPQIAGKKVFYFRRSGEQNQPVNYYRSTIWDAEKVLLDPNTIDPTGLTAISWLAPSKDGSLVAYGEYKSGDENSTLKIIEPETGKKLAEEIPGKVGGVCWLPDNSGFIYSKLADLNNPYSRQICFHKLGKDPQNDAIIFEQYKDGPLATTWGPFATLSADGKWLVLGYHTSTRSNDLWLANFEQWLRTGELKAETIAEGLSATFHAEVNEDKLYIYTNYQAQNGRLLLADLQSPALEKARVLIAERKDAVLQQWGFSANYLLLDYQIKATTNIQLFSKEGKLQRDIKLPGLGTASFTTDDDSDECFISYTSFAVPTRIFHIDLAANKMSEWFAIKVEADLNNIEVSQKWFKSKDGTDVSMFLVHKAGIARNGQNPTLIYGYGGFSIPMTPGFSPMLCPWLEDGGVYAMVNLRGGSEYGDQWHKDGMRDKKTKVFEDLEAAAEYLLQQKITSTDKLAVMGRSNGGLLAGAALTRRPDLYKAVICGVPLLDMLRYQKFLMARYWVPEYGSAEDAEQFKWLIEYSPYQNIKEGTRYPATFIHSGENDTRVHPLHARKMAAALQKFSGAADKQPILLWIDRESGHGQGKPISIRLLEETDQWLFLRWQLGMLKQ